MQLDLEMVDGRLVDFGRSALQQLPNQVLGAFEVTELKLALRTFERQAKCQLVLAAPVAFLQERHASRKIRARRCICRGRFGLSTGTKIDRRNTYFLVVIDQQCGTPIELIRDIEQMLGETVRRHALQQHSASPKVCPDALAFGDEGIGSLLNAVVEERIGAV